MNEKGKRFYLGQSRRKMIGRVPIFSSACAHRREGGGHEVEGDFWCGIDRSPVHAHFAFVRMTVASCWTWNVQRGIISHMLSGNDKFELDARATLKDDKHAPDARETPFFRPASNIPIFDFLRPLHSRTHCL
jgi:hypothetical protein